MGGGGRVIEDAFDDSGANELKLELDIARASSKPPPKPPVMAPPSMRPQAAGPTGVPASHRPPPPGAAVSPGPRPATPPQVLEDEVQRRQAAALGAYGEPPRHIWEAPMYAYRVYARQAELKKELVLRKREAQQASTALEDAIIAFAERVRPRAEAMPFYLRAFDPVRALEEQIRSLDGTSAAEMDQHRARMRDLDAKVTQAEQALNQVQIEERRIADDLARTEAALERARAAANPAARKA
jgi:hypothetical protein